MFSFGTRRSDRAAADLIYAAIVAQARQPVFFRDWAVPDTLDGRFEMLALHIFAVTERLMQPSDGDAELARFIAEAFFSDMDAAFREMGVGDLTVPKRIKTLYRSFGGRLQAYRAGMRGEAGQLADAIARNVFTEGDRGGASELLSTYLYQVLAALQSVPLSELRTGALPFPAPAGNRE